MPTRSGRRRVGVALVLDRPVADEVEGLRRALGDPGLGRIPPHITLVPPVNLGAPDLPAALAVLRSAAAGQPGPLRLTLGSVTTFMPANPVVYLAVGGELEALRRLRDDVFRPPLERKLSWPWVPHVTLGDGIPEERIESALTALPGYNAVADVDRVVLLEERSSLGSRRWEPIADAAFGRPARVGTGGLAVEMTASRLADPEALARLVDPAGPGPDADPDASARPYADPDPDADPRSGVGVGLTEPIVVTARREGSPVGLASAWVDLSGAHVAVLVDPKLRGQGIGGHLLARVETLAREAGWEFPELQADGPGGFYRARSRWAVT